MNKNIAIVNDYGCEISGDLSDEDLAKFKEKGWKVKE